MPESRSPALLLEIGELILAVREPRETRGFVQNGVWASAGSVAGVREAA
jgi:hypothetical protein